MRGRSAGSAALAVVLAAVGAGGAQASFPGDNGRIAYSSFPAKGEPRAIHTMSAGGKRDRQLTHRGSARNPSWSSDGQLIAFDSGPADGDGPSQLYVMKSNGHRKRGVPTEGLDARNPSWSPNGRRLVFQGCPLDSDCEKDSIFVVRRRGGGLRQIAAEGSDPVWSPNGRWIAYAGKLRDDGCGTIVLVRPSGRNRHAVLTDDPDESGACPGAGGLDFAPDSKALVYFALRPRKSGSFPDPVSGEMHPIYTYDHVLYTVGVDGDGRRLVERRAIEDSSYLVPPFAWSPDGGWLLWRDEGGTFLSRPNGRSERKITGPNGGGGDYAWQPL